MGDNVSKKIRSKIMSCVKQRHSGPEKKVRSLLHSLRFRFRLHRKDLPGTPDIVLPKYNTVIFVHGCFWHQHPGCKKAGRPSSNTAYWNKKLDENILRDRTKTAELVALGWKVLVVWQCELNDRTRLINRIKKALNA